MPRNGSGVYSKPSGTTAAPNTTIESAKYNSVVDDLVADANAARPVNAGGTGGDTILSAQQSLELEKGVDVQAYDADLAAIAGLTSAADKIPYYTGSETAAVADFTAAGRALLDDADAAAQRTTLGVGTGDTPEFTGVTIGGVALYTGIPQSIKSADYTLVLADAQTHIIHPTSDTTARTFTIPANASVAFPIGTVITFINDTGAGALGIAITSDTLTLAGVGTTGTRTLAADGIASIIKKTATTWVISGAGLS